MNRRYSLPLALLLAFSFLGNATAQTTAWRPFRPGLVYAFRTAQADSIFTFRVDSVYTDGPDSVYRFNRTLRVVRGGYYHPTKNNLFGARMQFRPGTGTYTFYLEADVLGPARQWTLQTKIKAGDSYGPPAGETSTTTALSKVERPVLSGLPDSVLTLRTSAPDNDSLVFSRRYGALQLPRSLYHTQARSRPLYLAELPVSISQSHYYSPSWLFDFQPGDEFGFRAYNSPLTVFQCYENLMLRRILTRQQTVDSLIYIYQQQRSSRTLSVGAPGCASSPSSTISPIIRYRLAVSLATARSSQLPALALITGEYSPKLPAQAFVYMGLPIIRSNSSGCLRPDPVRGSYFLSETSQSPAGMPAYRLLPDGNGGPAYATGVGEVNTGSEYLNCVRHQPLTGPRTTCGTCGDFSLLLPTRTALAANAAALHPNPATEAATLTLAAPARAGTSLTLTDALGRRVWTRPVATSQVVLPIPLTSLPAGLYLVQLLAPGATLQTWKLEKQ